MELAAVRARARAAVATVLREHGLPLAIVATHAAVYQAGIVLGWLPDPLGPLLAVRHTRTIVLVAIAWLPLLGALAVVRTRGQGLRAAWRHFRACYGNAATLLGLLPGAFFFAQSALVHDHWKNLLGVRTPYTWDATLARVDQVIHFGAHPWQLLDPFFRSHALTMALDTAYWLWYPLLTVAGSWILWTCHRELRTRILVTWALVWVVCGTMLAHLMASGGPVFYHHLVEGASPYHDLRTHLQAVHALEPLTAVNLQRLVWENAASGNTSQWLAMSAMPSLHVGAPVLLALGATARHPAPGALLWAFAIVILLGSIYLGWHYALDGYVALLACVLLWRVAGWAVRPRQSVQRVGNRELHEL